MGTKAAIGCAVLFFRPAWGLYDPKQRIQSACLYGSIDEYAYYFVDVIVGNPAQRVSVIADTGSKILAFSCSGCHHCGQHIDPAFRFPASTTARWEPCSRGCARCTGGNCSYQQIYTEGSSISGNFFYDYVRLGDAFQGNPPVWARMGCHDDENNLFFSQRASGILGLGPPTDQSSKTLLQEMFDESEIVDGKIFAMCLSDFGGSLVVGGHNESYHTTPIQWMDLTTSTGYYSVPLTSMKMNGKILETHFGRTIVDSGTTYTYMGSAPYTAVRRAIENYCLENGGCGAKQIGTCWMLHDVEASPVHFPTLYLQFRDIELPWVPSAYLYKKRRTDSWCYAFENDGREANTVLGASWMMHQEIIFDMDAVRLGVASARCPTYRERPEHYPNLTALLTLPPAILPKPAYKEDMYSSFFGEVMFFIVVCSIVITIALMCCSRRASRVFWTLQRQPQVRRHIPEDDGGSIPPAIVGIGDFNSPDTFDRAEDVEWSSLDENFRKL